ncbi:MAG TPA: FtsX-like permease family protein, partial [Candidatus Polarisedimenticolaceae bacterium]|nr:FtsX-like permease family protein [Candidatus Polarisedimenticolaceae bacterium]
ALKEGGRSGQGGVGRQRLRSALVVSQVALSLVLLVGAGLLLRSLSGLMRADLGFEPEQLLTMQVNLSPAKYPDATRSATLYHGLIERVRALPGVRGAAAVNIAPFAGGNTAIELTAENGVPAADGSEPSADWRMVTPDYFRTLALPLREGRAFTDEDREGLPRVVVVSETLARRCWPGSSAVGRRVRTGQQMPWQEIVGVVGDSRYLNLAQEPRATLYFPAYQNNWNPLALVVRTSGEPAALVASIRAELKSLDADAPISRVRTMQALIADVVAPARFNAFLLGAFAAVALLLAAVGLYGVIAYAVTQRTQEIGVRVALGAQRRDVIRLVVGQGLRLVAGGVALGLGAAFLLTSSLASLLYGVTPTDTLVFTGVPLLLAAVALVACWIPAYRATRVDPLVALRCE